ncbi:predicted protein [Nematostella vectensis]|uniref:Phosphatidate cytidylyltransferase, mitochondrial n=1 Tax=Nematostella vectensis TaxID=45351 RepID=A7S007_NEMVE|nr:phosphatidate cytidylyltransferase, mitochondrial [Nematostella vectensis]EDO42934.1 predicted protein [Nematostella vectensis]|eukprot:XP_001634997.1 predicted protein [Nematostella vectensis]
MVDESNLNYFRDIVSRFPDGITLAFAYGSGVFKQIGNVSTDNMIDFVFVVDNPYDWHSKNLSRFPHHYSFMANLGVNAIVSLQDEIGAGVYYNTLIPFEGRKIKYGIISQNNFIKDLNDWEWLYISGRLHKPVQIITRMNNTIIRTALKENLQSALNAALLCLPEKFTGNDLFMKIAGLSYAGDFRMVVGEDKGKVNKIVESNLDEFKKLYHPFLSSSENIHLNSSCYIIQQNMDRTVTCRLLKSLPKTLLNSVMKSIGPSSSIDSLDAIAKDRELCSKHIYRGVSQIVLRSSITQSSKGVLSAGLLKTCAYSTSKVRKMFKGLIR